MVLLTVLLLQLLLLVAREWERSRNEWWRVAWRLLPA